MRFLLVSCCLVSSRLVLSCLVLSCLVLSCLVLSCLVLSCLVLSCLVLSCLVLSCLVLSCLVLSCVFPSVTYWGVVNPKNRQVLGSKTVERLLQQLSPGSYLVEATHTACMLGSNEQEGPLYENSTDCSSQALLRQQGQHLVQADIGVQLAARKQARQHFTKACISFLVQMLQHGSGSCG